ncbi:MAG: hypothetical protein IK015_03500 [Treponema sp.]|nr:hypothetical protein [Treponema sp.]
MGNDDKVKELSLFLSEELEPLRRSKKVRVYDLETEYAKTRNNRLWNVWIALGLTFVFVILVTICTVRGIGKSAERIDVNLSSFEDLNLQNLFNQLERAQENFEEASKRRASLQGTLDARIERAKQKMQADLDLLKRTSLSKNALAARREKIQSDYNKEVSAAHAEIDEQLKTADAEAKQYEEQLKSYDSENVARAQEWERKMDSERQARQLERQKLVDDYEAQLAEAKNLLEETRKKDFEERKNATNEIAKRYEEELASFDPVIKDSKTKDVITSANQHPLGVFNSETLLGEDAPQLSEEFSAALSDAEANYADLELLLAKSASIPHRNSMKNVVAGEKKLSYTIANSLARAALSEIKANQSDASAANQEVERMKGEVAEAQKLVAEANEQRDFEKTASQSYVNILNSSLVDEKTAGFVLDPSTEYGPAVFIRDSWKQNAARDGSTKVDIYNGKVKVGTGSLLFHAENYYISLDKPELAASLAVGSTFRIKTK